MGSQLFVKQGNAFALYARGMALAVANNFYSCIRWPYHQVQGYLAGYT